MSDLVRKIAQADEIEIEALLQAARQRYNKLFPDWELSLITMHRCSNQNEQLDRIIELLQKMKTPS